MGKPTGFMEYRRTEPAKRPVAERVQDHEEVSVPLPESDLRHQAARCMDCGLPFCHAYGCPLANVVPDVNDMVYHGKWRAALELLHATNNFPEITGRICPALCEAACTLSLEEQPVTARQIELQVAERGWDEGWIQPEPAEEASGRRVAIIGSGPAGLAAAQQLARAGHKVVVFEKDDVVGGILRYGIPDFKLPKHVIERRVEQLRAEGVTFETRVEVGLDISPGYLRRSFDAVVLTAGCRTPRDMPLPGRDLDGIHFAMDYLTQQNRANAGVIIPPEERITAEGKCVVVIGGGDTGADCVGTARRQGARSVCQIELLPKPPTDRPVDNPWPTWPQTLRTSTSHEEGCRREWSVLTKEFLGEDGHVRALKCARLRWSRPENGARPSFEEVPGSGFCLEAELALLACGFIHVEHSPIVDRLGLDLDGRNNVLVSDEMATSEEGVFAAGDCVHGASLVVHAIAKGREVAAAADAYLRSLS